MRGIDWAGYAVESDPVDLEGEKARGKLNEWLAQLEAPNRVREEFRLRLGYRRLIEAVERAPNHDVAATIQADPSLMQPLGMDLADPRQVTWIAHPSVWSRYGGLQDLMLKWVPREEAEFIFTQQGVDSNQAPPRRRGRARQAAAPVTSAGPWEAMLNWGGRRNLMVDLRALRPLPHHADVIEAIRLRMVGDGFSPLRLATKRSPTPPVNVNLSRGTSPGALSDDAAVPWGPLAIVLEPQTGPVVDHPGRKPPRAAHWR